jgi:hypothetical protein
MSVLLQNRLPPLDKAGTSSNSTGHIPVHVDVRTLLSDGTGTAEAAGKGMANSEVQATEVDICMAYFEEKYHNMLRMTEGNHEISQPRYLVSGLK